MLHILKILSAKALSEEELKAVWERYRKAGAVGKDSEGADFLQQASGCTVLADQDPAYTAKELREVVERAGLKWKEGYDGRVKRFRASDETVDSYGDIILQNGWDLKRYKKNPVLMYGHDYKGLPIGSCVKMAVEDKALMMDHLFALGDDYPFADTCFKLVDSRILKGNSVGFIPRKIMQVDDPDERKKLGLGKYGVVFVKSELLEDSVVSIGANPNALVQNSLNDAVRKGILTGDDVERVLKDSNPETRPPETVLEMLEQAKAVLNQKHIDIPDAEDKAVIPFKAHPLAPQDTKWDGPKQVKAAGVDDLIVMCTWYDAEKADVKGSYKLPHHLQADKHTVWKGVAAAMGVTLGARGGLKVPEAERKRVYGHLSKHYKEFDKTVPEYKNYDEAELKELEQKGLIVVEVEEKEPDTTERVDSMADLIQKAADQIERLADALIDIEARLKYIEDGLDEHDTYPGKSGQGRTTKPRGLSDVLFEAEQLLGLIKPKATKE